MVSLVVPATVPVECAVLVNGTELPAMVCGTGVVVAFAAVPAPAITRPATAATAAVRFPG